MNRFIKSTLLVFAGMAFAVAGTSVAQNMAFELPAFQDLPLGAYFTDPVKKLSQKGIIKGYDNGNFGPDDYVTRGQVATMIKRYDDEVVQELREELRMIQKELGHRYDDSCPGGYEPGESFMAPDGCNKCVCGEDGYISCTEMGCIGPIEPEPYPLPWPKPHPHPKPGEKCMSSDDCKDGYVCSTEYGDCHDGGDCNPWEGCPDVCYGYCKLDPEDEYGGECGNGICEEGEDAYCPPCVHAKDGEMKCMAACTVAKCPEDCDPKIPDDWHPEVSCDEANRELNAMIKESNKCEKDHDCVLYHQSCPFITCGAAVSEEAMESILRHEEMYLKACNDEPVACAGCAEVGKPVCRENRCVIEK